MPRLEVGDGEPNYSHGPLTSRFDDDVVERRLVGQVDLAVGGISCDTVEVRGMDHLCLERELI